AQAIPTAGVTLPAGGTALGSALGSLTLWWTALLVALRRVVGTMRGYGYWVVRRIFGSVG
ncbi:MAG: hypothetical protein ACRD0H_21025, partial [Actinomycetes bacterium]